LYSAADLFVGPSLEECLGQVFLEAAACGVPAIGFAIGGVPEALKDGIGGIVVSDATPAGLADAILRLHDDAELRTAMAAWARVWFENERTLASAYHRLHGIFRRVLPNGDELFGRKIVLSPRDKPFTAGQSGDALRTDQSWQALRGFGPWEGPYPEWNLGECRWQERLSASLQVSVNVTGRYTLMFRLRNLAPDQHIRITSAGRLLFDSAVPVSEEGRDWVVRIDADLEAPRTVLTCEATAAVRSPEGRALVLLVCGLEIRPQPGPVVRVFEHMRRLGERMRGASLPR
jgi:hypothetical protein